MPTPTPVPTATPTPILFDTNPATTGVFLGESCAPNPGPDYQCIKNYSTTYLHSLSFYVSYTDWSTSLGSFIKSEYMSGWVALNVTPLITWEPINVNYTDVIAGNYDTYLIASAQAVKAFNGTIFLRPFHEFNGQYNSYALANQGANPQADANFIASWQHMVNIFRQQGVTNVRWVWCYANHSQPNEQRNTWNDPVNAYPGDSYVDWVGFDAFNRGSLVPPVQWETFDQTIGTSYAKATTISPVRPVMIPELGTNEYGDGGAFKATWLSTMLTELPPAYPHLRAIGYFDLPRGGYTDNLNSSPASLNAWISGIRSVNASGVLNFRGFGPPMNALTTW